MNLHEATKRTKGASISGSLGPVIIQRVFSQNGEKGPWYKYLVSDISTPPNTVVGVANFGATGPEGALREGARVVFKKAGGEILVSEYNGEKGIQLRGDVEILELPEEAAVEAYQPPQEKEPSVAPYSEPEPAPVSPPSEPPASPPAEYIKPNQAVSWEQLWQPGAIQGQTLGMAINNAMHFTTSAGFDLTTHEGRNYFCIHVTRILQVCEQFEQGMGVVK